MDRYAEAQGVVRALAGRYARTYQLDFEELVSEADIPLARAMASYEAARGSWGAWAYRHVADHLRGQVRRRRWRQRLARQALPRTTADVPAVATFDLLALLREVSVEAAYAIQLALGGRSRRDVQKALLKIDVSGGVLRAVWQEVREALR